TAANVDKVLNEVRPFLIADGGNVAIVEVDVGKRAIKLALEGACGSCPSSTTTMKMGVEKTLRSYFPNLTEISAVD
ncbi:NifU-like domain-containing protein, partial [Ochromonadaceae sp. CCMP2298]